MSQYYRRNSCRLCNSSALTEVFSLEPTPPANAFVSESDRHKTQQCYPLTLCFCEECSHLQLVDVVPAKELFEHYVYVSGTSPVFVEHFRQYAEECLSKFNLKKGHKVLDIGSNDGTLLRFFQEAGLEVLGIDPAKEISAQATESGIPTLNTFFTPELAEELLEKHGQFDLICANNVFAHSDDLQSFVQGIKTLLSENGTYVFEVSYLLNVYQDTLFDTIYHEHTAYHSVIPLIPFFKGQGLELVGARSISPHGGSLRGYVRHSGHDIESSVEEMVTEEEKFGLHKSSTFVEFADKIDSVRQKLTTTLQEMKSAGKTIGAYGAPAKATTLMYHFGITPEFIDFIVDDSPLKQGLFSPGMHIPVITSDEMYREKPDVLLILAWNFAEPIMKNNQRFLDEGGTFIVPLPQLEVFHE
ncbi:MAG: methyltransferase domain-containing protein [Desulfovibrio sp.]